MSAADAPARPARGPEAHPRWTRHALYNDAVFSATVAGVSRLPLAASRAIGHAGTWLAWRLMRESTAALVANLRVVRPEAAERELARLALAAYRSYALDTIDFIRSLDAPLRELERRVRRLDRAPFDRLLARGRGLLLATAHFGNWELGGVLLRRLLGYPVTVVGMPEPHPGVNRMRRRMRDRLGIDTLEVRGGVDTALRIRTRLGENAVVALLLDRPLGRDRVGVRFFGRPADFLRTPALLAELSEAPLLPAFLVRHADGTFEGVLGEPLEGGGPAEVAQRFAALLEEQVRARPHLWYQFYRYWEGPA